MCNQLLFLEPVIAAALPVHTGWLVTNIQMIRFALLALLIPLRLLDLLPKLLAGAWRTITETHKPAHAQLVPTTAASFLRNLE